MRLTLAMFLVWVGLMSQGCSPLNAVLHTLVVEPLHFCEPADCLFTKTHLHHLAKEAWLYYCGEHPELALRDDFEKGFRHAYADYIFAGGKGEPPLVPPLHYWNEHYRSPEGRQAIEDWFAGFRQGIVAAKASGLRELTIVPSGLSPSTAHPSIVEPPLDVPAAPAGPEASPAPRKLERKEVIPVPSSTQTDPTSQRGLPGLPQEPVFRKPGSPRE